jgi:flagellar hook assembly protein FlgD
VIRYNLLQTGEVKLTVYNVMGQIVATLANGKQQAGTHAITWQAGDVASGIYFARLETANQSKSIKMVLLK